MSKLPHPFLGRLEKQFGKSATDAIVAAFKHQRLPSLRVNTLKLDDDGIMKAFRADAIAFERVARIPHAFFIKNRTSPEMLEHHIVTSGQAYMQGIASMLPPIILDPQPGEKVLDLCAAPGSKTTQMAALMKGEGIIVALEDNLIRFEKLKNTIWMQDAKIVQPVCADATVYHYEHADEFDRILADVPCSAEGRVSMRDVRSFSFWSEKNIASHAKLQRRLLRSAVKCLKPGGTFVYSTCTLAPEENELMVDWFMTECPELEAVAFEMPLANVRMIRKNASIVLPSREHEGFFVAKFRKKK